MRIRSLAQETFFGITYGLGISSLFRALTRHRSGMISFHNVLPESELGDGVVYAQDISESTFVRQLEFLTDAGYLRGISELREPPDEGFFLSFDDGMLNNYEVVAPILERFGLTAMFAVCGGLVSGDIPHTWKDHFYLALHGLRGREAYLPSDDYRASRRVSDNNLSKLVAHVTEWVYENQISDIYSVLREFCEANGCAYSEVKHGALRFKSVTPAMLKEMKRAGHMIASHAWSHIPLKFLGDAEVADEMTRSKQYLEKLLGEPADVLVYPYGGAREVDPRVTDIARECGYSMAFSNVHWDIGGTAGFCRPRFSLQGKTSRPHLHALMSGFKHVVSKRRVWSSSSRSQGASLVSRKGRSSQDSARGEPGLAIHRRTQN